MKIGKHFLVAVNILLDSCTLFLEHTAVFFRRPVPSTGLGDAPASLHSPLRVDLGEKVRMELFHSRTIFELVLSGEYLLVRKLPVFDWQKRAMHVRIQLVEVYNEGGNILLSVSATNE